MTPIKQKSMDINRYCYAKLLLPTTFIRLLNVVVRIPIYLFVLLLPSYASAQPASDVEFGKSSLSNMPVILQDYIEEMHPPIDDNWADATESYFATMVHDFSTYIDHGLAKDEDEQQLENRSYLRLRTNFNYTHRGDFDSKGRVSVRVDLPHVEENWNLIFDTDPDDYDSLENKQRDLGGGRTTTSNEGAIGGVRLEGDQIKHWKTKFDIGIKIRWPIDPFVRTELQRVENVTDDWVTQFRQELFYYHSIGLGSLTELNFFYPVNDNHSTILSLNSSAQYLYEDYGWELLQQVVLADRINREHLMEYSVGIDIEPKASDEIGNYWLSATWRHKLYKNWLFLAITSQVDAPREYNYKANPGVLIEVEAFFSRNRKVDRLRRSIPAPTRTIN